MVCRRLLAGATSFISNLCCSHFFSMGPEGTWASSDMFSHLCKEQSPQWQQHKSPSNHPAEELATGSHRGTPMRLQGSQRLERTRNAMAEMEPQGHHRHKVHQGNPRVLETPDHQAP